MFLKYDYVDSFGSFKLFFSSFDFFFYFRKGSTTARGVHPPSFQGQQITFHLGALDLFLQQETKKRRHDYNEKLKNPL